MKEHKYAKELTRDYLEYLGITHVTEDGLHIYKGEKELHQSLTDNGYLNILLYDPRLRESVPKEYRTNTTGNIVFGVHRVVYVWYNRIQPPGLVVDHIDGNKQNNNLSNLQLLTPKENINKAQAPSTAELPCNLNKPRSFYERKLNNFIDEYEKAKDFGDAKRAHSLRSRISQTRARLRYYDSHVQNTNTGSNTTEDERRLYKARRAAQLKQFTKELRILHGRYAEALNTYGPEHPDTIAAKAKWKRGIQISRDWIEAHPVIRIKED